MASLYAFLQCFLWKDLDFAAEPTMHQVVVNNISAKPAGCIATLSLYKSLDLHKQQYPETARWQLKENSYFDDLGLKAGTLKRMAEVDNMDVGNIAWNLSLEESGLEPMLGIVWNPTRNVLPIRRENQSVCIEEEI